MAFPHLKPGQLPHEIKLSLPSSFVLTRDVDRFCGSIVGLAVGDALGASVEFRPHQYFLSNPVREMQGGGTWGLKAGQWTDDTSMALCLASSLITKKGYDPYDQMVRYKWWYKEGYMSSTGQCFDIGNATRDSLEQFIRQQNSLKKHLQCTEDQLDQLSMDDIPSNIKFNINCSEPGVAGNGALMRLAPVPLFFYRYPELAVEYAGRSGRLTHGDDKAYDACRYYGALIVAALQGETKEQLVDVKFYSKHKPWFGEKELHRDILKIAEGSYQNPAGYEGGIRGKGYIVDALEAALWAFWSDGNSFEKGALSAVNLGDDTDTTAAIYGQLAGAFYGYKGIPSKWSNIIYARNLLERVGQWIYYEAQQYDPKEKKQKIKSSKEHSTEEQINSHSSSSYNQNDTSYTYPQQHKYATKSRLESSKLSSVEPEYNRRIRQQQDNEQDRSSRANSDQWTQSRQNTNRSNIYVQQPQNNLPEKSRPLRTHHQEMLSSSVPRTSDYRISGEEFDSSKSLKHTIGNSKTFSPHSSTFSHPLVYGPVSTVENNARANDSGQRIIVPPTSGYVNDNPYRYDSTGMTTRSSENNHFPTNGIYGGSPHSVLTYTDSTTHYEYPSPRFNYVTAREPYAVDPPRTISSSHSNGKYPIINGRRVYRL